MPATVVMRATKPPLTATFGQFLLTAGGFWFLLHVHLATAQFSAAIQQHPNRRLLPSDAQCGAGADKSQIALDARTQPNEFPFVALLLRAQRPLCGGALINERYVLTAAACFESPDRPSPDRLRLGELHLHSDPDCGDWPDDYATNGGQRACAAPMQEFPVDVLADVLLHGRWDSSRRQHDIALVRLPEPADLSNGNEN